MLPESRASGNHLQIYSSPLTEPYVGGLDHVAAAHIVNSDGLQGSRKLLMEKIFWLRGRATAGTCSYGAARREARRQPILGNSLTGAQGRSDT